MPMHEKAALPRSNPKQGRQADAVGMTPGRPSAAVAADDLIVPELHEQEHPGHILLGSPHGEIAEDPCDPLLVHNPQFMLIHGAVGLVDVFIDTGDLLIAVHDNAAFARNILLAHPQRVVEQPLAMLEVAQHLLGVSTCLQCPHECLPSLQINHGLPRKQRTHSSA